MKWLAIILYFVILTICIMSCWLAILEKCTENGQRLAGIVILYKQEIIISNNACLRILLVLHVAS